MPRQARLDAPGVLHHIMIRGIERRKIFINDRDREDFLARLSKLLPQTETACYAWVFLSNHAHFLFRTGLIPLSSLMRRLLTGYAVSFNRRHKRRGQLFQNRYKSIVCQEDAYLKELVRYIHLNPVRAGIVPGMKELNKYPYSGHSALVRRHERPWQDVSYVLGYFGKTVGRARKAYVDFAEGGIAQGRREDLTGGGLIRSMGGWADVKDLKRHGNEHVMSDERILGDSSFVENLLAQADERYERRYELKRLGYDADRIVERVAEIYEMDPRDILSKGKQQQKVKARSLFCFWAVKELGLSLRELARRLELSPPAVGYSVERGEALARENGYRLIK
ncbi:MAG: transposase [Deltaproteobacteria bacterium]|nr:transposase [Deltaproteobacteria bacterium]MBW1819724.1 transposase [Deltaproteobacteria bacterium]